MSTKDYTRQLDPKSIFALVYFLKFADLAALQKIFRDFLFFFLKGDSDGMSLDCDALGHLFTLLDTLEEHGLIDEEDANKGPVEEVPVEEDPDADNQEEIYRKLKSATVPMGLLSKIFSQHTLKEGQQYLFDLTRFAMQNPRLWEKPQDELEHFFDMYAIIGTVYEAAHLLTQIQKDLVKFSDTNET